MEIDPRPTVSEPDNDPNLWLEGIDEPDAVAWVDEQNRACLGKFGHIGFEKDRDSLKAIYDLDDKIPYVGRIRGHLYNFWRDATHVRGIWRRTVMKSFRSSKPDWEVLLDIDALADKENENWIFSGLHMLPAGSGKVLIRLSRGGGDAVVLREFDLHRKAFVEDGFCLPEAKSAADWIDADTLLLSSSHGDGMATDSGYPRCARVWRRGQAIEDAKVVFETARSNVSVYPTVDRTGGAPRIWVGEQLSFFDYVVWLGETTDHFQKLDLPSECRFDAQGDTLAVKRRLPWEIDGTVYPPGTLLTVSLSDLLAGNPRYEVVFEPQERRSLQNFFWNEDQLVLAILDNLVPVVEILSPSEEGWQCDTIPDLPDVGVANVWRLERDPAARGTELLHDIQTPISPSTMYISDSGQRLEILKHAPQTFDSSGLIATRHEAVSSDGERIPYVQIGPSDAAGDAPVHMTGYGGFQVPELPYYRSAIGKLWLERGGTSVIANIRGGGEFGPEWHEAGRRAGRILSHDDFAAVAADLVARGVTVPGRIAAEGGSNGGILISNMLTRYPDRFGALLCTIPLVDMRRFHKLLAGASWISEYGDPDREEDWAFLQQYSAYHAAVPDKSYPPIMLATTRRDDRVHPGHARKMAAKLQAMGYEAHYYELDSGGHSYGKSHADTAAFLALGYTFLREAIGWTDAGANAA